MAVLESLYRAANWEIQNASQPHQKENSSQIRFDVSIPAEDEAVLRYTVHYSW